ncbi:MAG: hypothetical protein ACJ75S_08555 [Solirubrobacterales bacterium]
MRRLPLGVKVPGSEGRTLRIRPALAGTGVQLAIVGKRGSLVEALCVDLVNVPAVIYGIDGCSEIAWDEFQKQPRRPHFHGVPV